MEFEPSSVIWKSRGSDAVVGTSVVNSKEGTKLVLVTTQSEVVEYCTQTRKCVNHWTFRPGSSAALRLPAVRNPISQTYFGLRAAKKAQPKSHGSSTPGETLVSWKQSDLDVSKWKKVTLTGKPAVYGLFVHPQLSQEVLVVYENGRFGSFDDALTQGLDTTGRGESSSDESGAKVVWASLASNSRNPVKGALLLSMLMQSTSDAAQYELVVSRIVPNKERRDARIAATPLARHQLPPAACKTTSVVSCAFHAETLSYSIILSTGEWQMVYFRHDALSSTLEYASTKKITILGDNDHLDNATTPVHKKRKLSNAGVASHQFVASGVGPFSYLVVACSAAPQKLIGWDSKFGVQVASTEVSTTKDSASNNNSSSVPLPLTTTTSTIGQIRSLVSSLNGETVVAAYDQAVFLLNVKNKHSTLASVLGVYSGATTSESVTTTSTEAPPLPNSSINWADVANNKIPLSDWQQTICGDDATEQQLIAELIDPSVTKVTQASFQKKFDAAVQKLGGAESLSYRFVMAVTRHCIDAADTKVAFWAPLKQLIQTKRLSSRALPALLPVLMKHNQFELLELALVHLSDIDERSIVRLLRFFIRKSGDKLLRQYVESSSSNNKKTTPNGKRKNSNASSEPTAVATPSSERFLIALLGLPTNNVFLHHAIRELQLADVLFLLAICMKYFYAHAEQNEIDTAPSKGASVPSSTQFCGWICALIDGHVAQLVLTAAKDTKTAKALEQLDTLVQQQLVSCDRFEGVHNVLGNFLSGVKLPRAHGIPDYSIEELVI